MHERRRARAGLTRFAGPRTERRLGFARLQVAPQEWGALTRVAGIGKFRLTCSSLNGQSVP